MCSNFQADVINFASISARFNKIERGFALQITHRSYSPSCALYAPPRGPGTASSRGGLGGSAPSPRREVRSRGRRGRRRRDRRDSKFGAQAEAERKRCVSGRECLDKIASNGARSATWDDPATTRCATPPGRRKGAMNERIINLTIIVGELSITTSAICIDISHCTSSAHITDRLHISFIHSQGKERNATIC